MTLPAPPSRRPGRAWLIAPALGLGLIAACVLVLVRSSRESRSVSDVVTDIHRIALLRSDARHRDHGGFIGPWWISANSVDRSTGELLQFRLSSPPMEVAAERARVIVDPADDTFSFDLSQAVITRIPERGEDGPAHRLLHEDRYLLGPAPLGIDIVPDASDSSALSWSTSAVP